MWKRQKKKKKKTKSVGTICPRFILPIDGLTLLSAKNREKKKEANRIETAQSTRPRFIYDSPLELAVP